MQDRRKSSNTGGFDRAVVYWNARDFFEAHEDWETLWHEAEGEERRWLQGLIQLAAAFVHYERGFFASGFVRLMRQGIDKVKDYTGDTWGLDMHHLLSSLRAWHAHAGRVESGRGLRDGAPEPVPRLAYLPGVVPVPSLVDEDGA